MPHSPPGSATECSTPGSPKKQVCFDLTKDLGDTLPLLAGLAHSLGGTTDEWIDAPCPPASSTMNSPWPPSPSSDQHHDTPTGGAQPKTSTTVSSKPMAASQARTRHSASLDMMGKPIDCVWASLAKRGEPQSCWLEFWSLV